MVVAKIVRSIVFIIMAGAVTGAAAKTPSGPHSWPPCSEWPYCQPITHGNESSDGKLKTGNLSNLSTDRLRTGGGHHK